LVYDGMSSGLLEFVGDDSSAVIVAESSDIVPDNPGETLVIEKNNATGAISVYITGAQIEANRGGLVLIMVTAAVGDRWHSGESIVNTAELYYEKAEKPDPDEDGPDEYDTEETLPMAPVENFEKISDVYSISGEGSEITYTINFRLPADIDGYEGLLIYDPMADGKLEIDDISGWITDPEDSNETVALKVLDKGDGAAWVYIELEQLSPGAEVSITIEASVSTAWTSGPITNKAGIYVQKLPGGEEYMPDPEEDEPEAETSCTVTQFTPGRFTKTVDGQEDRSYAVGDEITFLLEYAINEVSDSTTILITDTLSPVGVLDFLSGTVFIDGVEIDSYEYEAAGNVYDIFEFDEESGEITVFLTGAWHFSNVDEGDSAHIEVRLTYSVLEAVELSNNAWISIDGNADIPDDGGAKLWKLTCESGSTFIITCDADTDMQQTAGHTGICQWPAPQS